MKIVAQTFLGFFLAVGLLMLLTYLRPALNCIESGHVFKNDKCGSK
jgi:hypothetical protein